MPEGDTIFRTAASLRSWIGGRVLTDATARDPRLRVDRLIGRQVALVATHGKHLFMEFPPPAAGVEPGDHAGAGPGDHAGVTTLVLRTHMMMTGSWHVYSPGDRWRRPPRQAVVSLVAADRIAVCFNAPVVELTSKRRSQVLRSVASLGPDILDGSPDTVEILRRAHAVDASVTVGSLLLDQHVVAGIGNIYRCESLFLERLSPFLIRSELPADRLVAVVARASELMRANLSPSPGGRSFGSGSRGTWVYGRTGRPCRRCRTAVRSERLGSPQRTVYWCPTCQPDGRSPETGVGGAATPGYASRHGTERRGDS